MNIGTAMEVQCPLCGGQTKFWGALPETLFDCAVCGRFKMTFELTADRDMQGEPHPYLSAATPATREDFDFQSQESGKLPPAGAYDDFTRKSKVS
jgi:hypothetical protein